MAVVDDWFEDFVFRYTERLYRSDWPSPRSEFWAPWRASFIRHGVTEEVADAASVALAESPPEFLDRHLGAMIAAVKAVWAASEVVPAGLSDRDSAHAAMRALFGGGVCDDCHGQGFAVRYRRQSLGQVDCKGRPVSPAVQFYCLCPVGRWVERCHREGPEEARVVRKRVADLADFPALHGYEFRTPPGLDDDRPAAEAAAAVKAMLPRHRAERGQPAPPAVRPPSVKAEPSPEAAAAGAAERSRQLAELAGRLPRPGTVSEIADGPETREDPR